VIKTHVPEFQSVDELTVDRSASGIPDLKAFQVSQVEQQLPAPDQPAEL